MQMRPEVDRFLREHRFGVLVTVRRDGSPQASPVYYDYDGERIRISTTKDRAKYRNILRDSRVTFCVLQEEPPFRYVTVHGRADVTDGDIVEPTAAIFRRFRDDPLPENFEEQLRRARRVIVSITPERAIP